MRPLALTALAALISIAAASPVEAGNGSCDRDRGHYSSSYGRRHRRQPTAVDLYNPNDAPLDVFVNGTFAVRVPARATVDMGRYHSGNYQVEARVAGCDYALPASWLSVSGGGHLVHSLPRAEAGRVQLTNQYGHRVAVQVGGRHLGWLAPHATQVFYVPMGRGRVQVVDDGYVLHTWGYDVGPLATFQRVVDYDPFVTVTIVNPGGVAMAIYDDYGHLVGHVQPGRHQLRVDRRRCNRLEARYGQTRWRHFDLGRHQAQTWEMAAYYPTRSSQHRSSQSYTSSPRRQSSTSYNRVQHRDERSTERRSTTSSRSSGSRSSGSSSRSSGSSRSTTRTSQRR